MSEGKIRKMLYNFLLNRKLSELLKYNCITMVNYSLSEEFKYVLYLENNQPKQNSAVPP